METLFDKKIVCHYENLNFYVNHDLVVDKLNRVCGFGQSKWLGVYLEENAVIRKQAVNDFEKKIYKLMSNAVSAKRWKF